MTTPIEILHEASDRLMEQAIETYSELHEDVFGTRPTREEAIAWLLEGTDLLP